MDANALRDELQKAVDGKLAVVAIRDSHGNLTLVAPSDGDFYPLSYARIRDDGLVEAGDEWESWLIDASDVTHVHTCSRDHPMLSKQFPGGQYA
jgi:hypothetical protein